MFKKTYLLFFILIIPTIAYAYLDPGTGAVLINVIIASIAAGLYFIKGFFLKLFGKKKGFKKNIINNYDSKKIGLFSEGKQYWSTFKPIIEALLNKQQFFNYYTLDIEDPALQIENSLMNSKFLGYGFMGYLRASNINVETLLSTTPNIGTKNSLIKRFKYVKNIIHVFHSISDISMYKIGSLDAYNTVIMAGPFQEKSIKEIEKIRKLPPKELISIGLPYLDTLINEKVVNNKNINKTLLVASSWGEKGCFNVYGIDFIINLAQLDYNIIVRPHPQSFVSEKKQILHIKKTLSLYKNIEWDDNILPSNAMSKTDILISDTSSIRYDFAFIYEKPVISLLIESNQMPGFERDYLKTIWDDKAHHIIGKVIEKKDIEQLPSIIAYLLNNYDVENLRSFRDETLNNFGKAGKAITDYLIFNK